MTGHPYPEFGNSNLHDESLVVTWSSGVLAELGREFNVTLSGPPRWCVSEELSRLSNRWEGTADNADFADKKSSREPRSLYKDVKTLFVSFFRAFRASPPLFLFSE